MILELFRNQIIPLGRLSVTCPGKTWKETKNLVYDARFKLYMKDEILKFKFILFAIFIFRFIISKLTAR